MPQPRKTNRRQFLRGESAVEAIGDLTHGTTGDDDAPAFRHPPTSQAAETFFVQLSRTAMACEFEIYLTADHPPYGPEAAMAALDLVDKLEDQLTVYREHSEICQINRRAADADIHVELQLFQLLQYSVQLFHETGGAFDITAGPLTKAWGFFRREGSVPTDEQLRDVLKVVGSGHLELDEAKQTIRFAKPGMELNLGGIGKGYALDRAADLLAQRGIDNFLFHGGRSSVLARGSRIPIDDQRRTTLQVVPQIQDNPWTIGIGHPLRPDRRLGILTLRDRAMSTSGSATQSFHHQGRRLGHILDPRTGRPAEGVLSVTVLTPDAATADALSTALYVLGPDKAESFCDAHPDVAALIVLPTKSIHQVEVLSLNMPEETWQPHV